MGINPKTVAKWKKRSFANESHPMGPKEMRSTVPTKEEEAAVVAFLQIHTFCCRWMIACMHYRAASRIWVP